ncbi:MAG: OFA family MFS transporter [Xenococcaceae cyanobacterium MO_234.B1]|nr:OFA family MFS transporter [Xenococcaceae cyanobacterium MO_234.B1]
MKRQLKNFKRKRWLIALAAIIIQLCLGTGYAWSVFKNDLVANQGWDEIPTSITFMICNGVIGLAAAFGGILVDRKGPKLVATIGGISFGIGTIIGGIGVQMENILILYLGYGLLGGLGRGIGYVTPIATLIRWFPDQRGLVTGLAVMGVGAGAFLMGLIAPANIAAWGVANTLYLWGLIFWVLIVGSAQFLKNPPPGWQPAGFNPKAELRTSEAESCSFGEAIKSSQWWMLWSMLFLNVTAGIGLISQLSPLARELCPALRATALSSEQLALAVDFYGGLVVAVASIFNALGRLFWAWLSDGIGRKAVFSLLFLTQAVLYLIIPEIDSYYWFVVVSSYLLACYGGGFATMPAFAADAFGSQNIGRIYGTMLTAWGAAGVVGPFIFSWVKQKTGSCNQALYLAAGLLGLGFILARKYQRPLCHKNC